MIRIRGVVAATVAGSSDALALTQRFADILGKFAPPALAWHYEPMQAETHATIYHPAAILAIRRLFKPAPSK
jgi:hypothetical protein